MVINLIKSAIDFIVPSKCPVCGGVLETEGNVIFGDKSPICFSCLKQVVPLNSNRRWFLCLSEPFAGDPYPDLALYMPFVYNGIFSRVIPIIKFKHNTDLARFFGLFLGELMKTDGVAADIIVPVPLSGERLLERGFNQAELIAKSCGEILNIPVVNNCIIRNKYTLRQTSIQDKFLRSQNVDNAFSVSEEWVVDRLNIILIDDVVTTGNTIHEAAVALKDKGAANVICVALAGNRAYKNSDSY